MEKIPIRLEVNTRIAAQCKQKSPKTVQSKEKNKQINFY